MFLRDGEVPGRDTALAEPGDSGVRQRRFFEGLDGIRFVAAFLIVVHHAGFASGLTFESEFLGLLLTRMDIGVSIFFVLSGFLLYRPYVVAQFAARPFPSTRFFWVKRAARIYPAYWAAFLPQLVLGAISVVGAFGVAVSFGLVHVYLPSRAVSGMTQSWTLATELGFYFVLPGLAMLGRRFSAASGGGTRTINRQAFRLITFCAALFFVSLAFRFVMAKSSPYPLNSWGNASRLWTPSYIDMFGAGMALAVVSAWADLRPMIREAAENATRRPWVWWVTAVVLFWWAATQFGLDRGLALSSPQREAIRQAVYLLVGVLAVVPVIFAPVGSSPGLRLLASRPMAYLGVISYGIYLWHQAFIHWAQELLGYPEIGGSFLVLVIAGTVGAIGAAALSHRYIEEPVSALVRRRFRR
jgi:peptidoglycan/LPS O-acetylase OafA/YrhL